MTEKSRRSLLTLGFALPLFVAGRGLLAQTAAGTAEQRLKERGIVLPPAAAPIANYSPSVRSGNLIYVSGQGPRKPDGTVATGKVGKDVTVEESYQHARFAGLTVLAVLRAAVGNDLDKVVGAVKVFGMVNAIPEFMEHPKVINGCTDLFVEVFGDRGRPARSAVGMGSLPSNITVEIEAMFEVS